MSDRIYDLSLPVSKRRVTEYEAPFEIIFVFAVCNTVILSVCSEIATF